MVTMPFIYFIILIMWAFLLVGFFSKDAWLAIIASLALMILGVYILIYGLDNNFNLAVTTLGIIHIAVGTYVSIRGGIEKIGKD